MLNKIFQKLAVAFCTFLLLMGTAFPFGSKQIIARADSLLNIGVSDISPEIPDDIPGGVSNASLTDAAIFAWKEFIALNWSAVTQNGNQGNREQADTTKHFGENTGGPLVWETFRHKVEIFPAQQDTNYTPEPYDQLPNYQYFDEISPCKFPLLPNGDNGSTPWVNLDENSEIGLAKMFAGEDPGIPLYKVPLLIDKLFTVSTRPEFLYLAKANRQEYDYVTNQGNYHTDNRSRWNGFTDKADYRPPTQATINYLINNTDNAPPASADKVSLPTGTIEIKSAWRPLSTGGGLNDDPSHFHTAPVRFYVGGEGNTCYINDTKNWGMGALHIIHKTKSAPYFIFATFSQEDNLRDTTGKPVEDATGKYTGSEINPLTPNVTSTPASSYYSLQQIGPATASSTPGKSLYYDNTQAGGIALPQGTVTVNKREVPIPQEIQDVNQAFQSAISQYNSENGINNSPWEHYKLVNVQYNLIDKKAGVEYDGTTNTINGTDKPIDKGSYYLANDVVETDYVLQKFSGAFQPNPICKGLSGIVDQTCLQNIVNAGLCQGLSGNDLTNCQKKGKLPSNKAAGLITDFVDPDYQVASDTNKQQFPDGLYKNVYHQGNNFNMGGCIGCHGNAANRGTDFSFILSGGPGSSTAGLLPDSIDTGIILTGIPSQEELQELKPRIQTLIKAGGEKAPLSNNFTKFFGQ